MSAIGQRATRVFWSVLSAKGSGGVLLNLLSLIFIPFLLWALTGWATGEESTANAVFLVTFAVIATFLLFRFLINRRAGGKGKSRLHLTTLTILGVLALLASAPSSVAGTTTAESVSPLARSWGETGGVDWKRFDSPNLRLLPGCTWAKVWHNGRQRGFPVNIVYRFTLRLDYCHDGFRFTKIRSIKAGPTRLSGFVDWHGVMRELNITAYYNCDINGRYTVNGCLHIKRRAKVAHDLPVKGKVYTAYPWVELRVNGAGEVLWWDWNDCLC